MKRLYGSMIQEGAKAIALFAFNVFTIFSILFHYWNKFSFIYRYWLPISVGLPFYRFGIPGFQLDNLSLPILLNFGTFLLYKLYTARNNQIHFKPGFQVRQDMITYFVPSNPISDR